MIDTNQFLKTNLKDYLKRQPEDNLDTQDAFREKKKVLTYKYPSNMLSHYSTTFNKFD